MKKKMVVSALFVFSLSVALQGRAIVTTAVAELVSAGTPVAGLQEHAVPVRLRMLYRCRWDGAASEKLSGKVEQVTLAVRPELVAALQKGVLLAVERRESGGVYPGPDGRTVRRSGVSWRLLAAAAPVVQEIHRAAGRRNTGAVQAMAGYRTGQELVLLVRSRALSGGRLPVRLFWDGSRLKSWPAIVQLQTVVPPLKRGDLHYALIRFRLKNMQLDRIDLRQGARLLLTLPPLNGR